MRAVLWACLTSLACLQSALTESDQPRVIERHADEIKHIPGLETSLKSRHYGGYITVDEAHGRHMYYYFVTSQGNPGKDPLVLWLNGGPGCSSLDGVLIAHLNNSTYESAA